MAFLSSLSQVVAAKSNYSDLFDVSQASSTARFLGHREDSLVFLLGLLNLATVLCYSVYSQFKDSVKKSSFTSDEYLQKKIQSILDELVLHVHTTNYYRNAISQEEKRSFSGIGRRMGFASYAPAPSPAAVLEPRSGRTVMSFFDLPDTHEPFNPNTPVAAEEKNEARSATSRKSRLLQVFQDSYKAYLEQEEYKLMEDWVYLLGITPSVRMKRETSTVRGTIPKRSRSGRRGKGRAAGTDSTKRSWNRRKSLQPGSKKSKMVTGPVFPQSVSAPGSPVKQAIANDLRAKDVPVTAALKTVEAQHHTDPRVRDNVPLETNERHVNAQQPYPGDKFHAPEATDILYRKPSFEPPFGDKSNTRKPDTVDKESIDESDGFIGRLMQLLTQTTPVTLDVLNIYRTRDNDQQKCTERLICQVNQDTKIKGTVSAALSPFLSVLLGWWLEGGSNPSLPQVLMAVRAGWIGKNCAALYPRCTSHYEHTVWSLSNLDVQTGTHGYKESLPKETEERFDHYPRPLPLGQHKEQAVNSQSSLNYANLPAVMNINEEPAEPSLSSRQDIVYEPVSSDRNKPETPETTTHFPNRTTSAAPANSAVVGASLQVVTQEEPKDELEDRIDEKEADENISAHIPWGKPSRLDSNSELSLSEIVRGVYPVNVGQKEPQTIFGGVPFVGGENHTSPQSEHEESIPYSPNMLHDLTEQQFNKQSSKDNETESEHPHSDGDDVAEAVGTAAPPTVPPWLASPSWVGGSHDDVYSNEADLDANTDTRDRVPFFFTPDDAVKDVRRHEQVLQYIRDRSS